MEKRERQELIDDLLNALDQRHVGEGGRLLDLMRAEQNLVDALGAIRREIDLIIRAEAG
jgi:hypothetical protein